MMKNQTSASQLIPVNYNYFAIGGYDCYMTVWLSDFWFYILVNHADTVCNEVCIFSKYVIITRVRYQTIRP